MHLLPNKDNISFTSDILQEVSKENDIPIEIVKYSFDICLKNLENLVKNTDTTSIFIPFIGTMYVNYENLKLFKKGSDRRGKNTDIIQSKIEKIEEYTKNVNKIKRNYFVNRHLQKKFLNNKYFSKGLSVVEIEKIQNNETRE